MSRTKKAVLDNLGNLVTGLGALVILLAIIFLIMAETQDQVIELNPCSNISQVFNTTTNLCNDPINWSSGISDPSEAFLAQVSTQEATSDIPGWMPIVVITIIGGLLVLLVRNFRQK